MKKIIKISTIFIISLIIFSILSLLGLYFLLATKGLNLTNIDYQNIHIGKLYIKIDKKIILNAQNILIKTKKSNSKTNYSEINKLIKNNFIYLNYFQNISLKNMQINNNQIKIIDFNNNKLKIDTDLIYLNASIFPKNTKIDFIIYKLVYKPMKIELKNIKGYEKADLFKLNIFLQYNYAKTNLNLNLEMNKHTNYKLNIKNLNQIFIDKFISLLKLKEKNFSINANKIIISGDENRANFNINNLLLSTKYNFVLKIQNSNGYIDLKKLYFNINLNNIDVSQIINQKPMLEFSSKYIQLNGNEEKINFSSILDSINLYNYKLLVTIPKIDGKYNIKNNTFTSTPHKIYIKQLDNKNLDKIVINSSNITLKNNKIFVDLSTNELLNNSIIKLLQKFNLKIPISQKNGKNNLNIKLHYNLTTNKIDTYIKGQILNSQLMITKNDYLFVKKADIELNNSIIKLKNSELNYKKSIIDLDYKIDNGIIDLTKNYIKTDGIIKNLKIKNLGDIKNFKEEIYINLNKLYISIKNLQTTISIGKITKIEINKLSKLYPYIPYLKKYKILDGKIKIKILKNKTIINSNISKTNQKILAKNFIYLKKFNIDTTIKNNKIIIKNDGNFKINITNNNPMKIYAGFKNIDINITQFINDALKEKNSTKKDENNKTKQSYIVDAYGINNYILYNSTKLYSHSLKIHYDKNLTKISSLDRDRNITLIYKNKTLKIFGFNIRNKELKDLANIDFIKNVKLKFFAYKTKNSPYINGFIHIDRGYIKELKALNNIVAFINLVPSLITLHGAGFSGKGFKIRDAHIDYIYYQGILYIKDSYIKGDNLNFKAQGYIDLIDKKIKMKVDVTILVKLIKDIPIVNYILLGKDGGITLKLKLTGDLTNPKVTKNLTKQIISAPFGIIKRTLETPFRLFK